MARRRNTGRRKSPRQGPKSRRSKPVRRRWLQALRRAPFGLQVAVGIAVLAGACVALNWAYQVLRKPSELFFPVSGTLYKTPTETWESYAPIFRRHATATIGAEYLAALAQVEGSGNPVARTYWRLALSQEPFEIYRPASSAVGMYQITDGTFAQARRFCVHDHVVVEDGPWNDVHSCWFNSLYVRTVPAHAVELTAAYLDRHVNQALARRGIRRATATQKHDLASVIHLCGAGAGRRLAARGLRLRPGQRCGDHDVARYVARVNAMKAVFRRIERGAGTRGE